MMLEFRIDMAILILLILFNIEEMKNEKQSPQRTTDPKITCSTTKHAGP